MTASDLIVNKNGDDVGKIADIDLNPSDQVAVFVVISVGGLSS